MQLVMRVSLFILLLNNYVKAVLYTEHLMEIPGKFKKSKLYGIGIEMQGGFSNLETIVHSGFDQPKDIKFLKREFNRQDYR